MKNFHSACAALFFVGVSSGALFAQTETHARPSAWVTGASAGVPGNASGWEVELFTISAHATRVVAGRLGADFAVGTMPRILVEGVLPLGARAGLALPLALSEDMHLLPSGGASLIAVLGDGSLVEPGLNVGAAALFLGEVSSGVRVGITRHWFRGSSDAVWLLEFGFVRRGGGR